MNEAYSCAACCAETENEPYVLCDACKQDDRDATATRLNFYRKAILEAVKRCHEPGTTINWIESALTQAILR